MNRIKRLWWRLYYWIRPAQDKNTCDRPFDETEHFL